MSKMNVKKFVLYAIRNEFDGHVKLGRVPVCHEVWQSFSVSVVLEMIRKDLVATTNRFSRCSNLNYWKKDWIYLDTNIQNIRDAYSSSAYPVARTQKFVKKVNIVACFQIAHDECDCYLVVEE